MGRRVLLGITLVIVTFAAYATALETPFVFDDHARIVGADVIRPPLSARALLETGRPWVTLSLAVNYALGGLAVFGYHVFNVAAHAVAVLLFYGLARTTLTLPVFQERHERNADAVSWFAAAIFALHPIQTESVTYIIQRAEILVAIAVLGGLSSAILLARGGRRAIWVPMLLLFGLLGAGSKQSFFTFPLVVLLYDWCFLAAGDLQRIRSRWALHAFTFAIGVMALAYAWPSVATSQSAGFSSAGISSWRYFTWQLPVMVHYLRVVLIPRDLCFDCGYLKPWPVTTSALADHILLPAVILAALAATAWVSRRRCPVATFSLAASALVLAPTSSFVPLADTYVEHRLYLPIAFLALLVATAGSDALRRLTARSRVPHLAVRVGVSALAITMLLGLGHLTISRNRVYADERALLRDSIAKAPGTARNHYRLARLYMSDGDIERAAVHYEQARELGLDHQALYVDLGVVYLRERRFEDALRLFERALRAGPPSSVIHRNIARAHLGREDLSAAIQAAERAVMLSPTSVAAHKLLGQIRRIEERRRSAN